MVAAVIALESAAIVHVRTLMTFNLAINWYFSGSSLVCQLTSILCIAKTGFSGRTIDMRRLSRPPPAPSTCDFMYTIDSALLYVMVVRNRTEILFDPLLRSSPFIGGQR
jgi:hypothetical protein